MTPIRPIRELNDDEDVSTTGDRPSTHDSSAPNRPLRSPSPNDTRGNLTPRRLESSLDESTRTLFDLSDSDTVSSGVSAIKRCEPWQTPHIQYANDRLGEILQPEPLRNFIQALTDTYCNPMRLMPRPPVITGGIGPDLPPGACPEERPSNSVRLAESIKEVHNWQHNRIRIVTLNASQYFAMNFAKDLAKLYGFALRHEYWDRTMLETIDPALLLPWVLSSPKPKHSKARCYIGRRTTLSRKRTDSAHFRPPHPLRSDNDSDVDMTTESDRPPSSAFSVLPPSRDGPQVRFTEEDPTDMDIDDESVDPRNRSSTTYLDDDDSDDDDDDDGRRPPSDTDNDDDDDDDDDDTDTDSESSSSSGSFHSHSDDDHHHFPTPSTFSVSRTPIQNADDGPLLPIDDEPGRRTAVSTVVAVANIVVLIVFYRN